MHQADTYNLAVCMDTESTKVNNNWSQKKSPRLTRKSGKTTISSQPLSTVVGGPDRERLQGSRGDCSWVGEWGARRVCASGFDDLIEEDPDDVIPIAKKTRKVRLIMTALLVDCD